MMMLDMIKRLLLLLVIACSTAAGAFAQWEKVTNLPAGFENEYFLDVYFLESDPSYGWVCGFNGSVMRTTDGGKTWSGVNIPTVYQLESINFTDPKNGYTSGLSGNGEGYIFRSTDGGRTWRNVSPDYPSPLWGNLFRDPENGMVIGGGCTEDQFFWRTDNGGRTWTLFSGFEQFSGLTDVLFSIKDNAYYAVSSGIIWKSSDDGRSWGIIARTGGKDWHEELTYAGSSFLVPYALECGGYGNGGGMRFSTDMGANWADFSSGTPMFGAFLFDSLRGWAVGHEAKAYYTSDGGNNWSLMNCGINDNDDLDDIWFINDSTGFVVGNGIYRYKKFDSEKPSILALGSQPPCEGDTVVLRSNREYKKYTWSTGETTREIKVTKSGTYSFSGYTNKCEHGEADALTLNFVPKRPVSIALSKTSPLCEGDSVVLTVRENFNSYEWSTGETTPSVTVRKSGKYKVIVKDSTSCSNSAEETITFHPNPKPVISISGSSDICTGDSLRLTLNEQYPVTSWYDETGKEIAAGVSSIMVGRTGRFSAYVKNISGCEGVSDTVAILVRDEKNVLDLNIYAADEFLIDSVYFPMTSCNTVVIKNIGKRDTILGDPYLTGNIAFSIPQSQLPLSIPAGDSAKLTICYNPTLISLQRDTLIIGDVCSPHIVRLKAVGLGDEFAGESGCGEAINARTKGINNRYKYGVAAPYPNPAKGIVRVSFVVDADSGNPAPRISGAITDNLGRNRCTGSIAAIAGSSAGSGIKYTGEVEFNAQGLPDGVYWAIIHIDGDRIVMPIVISR